MERLSKSLTVVMVGDVVLDDLQEEYILFASLGMDEVVTMLS